MYSPVPPLAIRNPKLIAWLAEAVLRSRAARAAAPRSLLSGPRLFPFRPGLLTGEALASKSARLDFVRHGLDDELVMIRRDSTVPQERDNPRRLQFSRLRHQAPT